MKTLIEHSRSMTSPIVEKRDPAPYRHNTETIYVFHRFPVKGGIAPTDLVNRMVKIFCEPNPIFGSIPFKRTT